MSDIQTKSYTLRYPYSNEWLAQVLISDDGMVAVCSHYGNFAFAWRGSASHEGIRSLLMRIDADYFAEKMAIGLAPLQPGKRLEGYLLKAAQQILPVLQDALRAEQAATVPATDDMARLKAEIQRLSTDNAELEKAAKELHNMRENLHYYLMDTPENEVSLSEMFEKLGYLSNGLTP